jgi:hypothetical protein
MSTIKEIVLAPVLRDGVYVVRVIDDADAFELFRGDASESLQAAIHSACDQLLPNERVVDTLEVEAA